MSSFGHANNTKGRLLDAAGEVFGAKGFHTASVREICQRADANIAAVNYHFGSKDKLYEAVVLEAFKFAAVKEPNESDEADGATVEERLFMFIHDLLQRRPGESGPAWHRKVMIKEIEEPGPALEAVVNKILRRRFDGLRQIMIELIPPPVDPLFLRLCQSSILAQCLYYHHRKAPIVSMLHGTEDFSPADIERIARHITDFSLTAIRNMSHPSPEPATQGKERDK